MPMMSTVTSGVEGARGTAPGQGTVPPPPPPPPVQPSGFALPTTDLPGFTLAWIEDFNRPCTEGTLTTNGTAAPWDNEYGVVANNDLAGGVPITIASFPSTYLDTTDRGRYGAAINSVAADSSIMRMHVRTEAGWPRGSVILPRLGNLLGAPYGASWVLGGSFELVWRSDIINTYKFVPLLWPLSNHRQTIDGVGADGEIDWPEANQFGGALIRGFMHWQGDKAFPTDSITEQTIATSATVLAGTGWHKTRTDWVAGTPSGIRSIGGFVNYYLDDVLIRAIPGSPDGVTPPFIPCTPMRWGIQQETHLGAAAIDATAEGFLDIDWMAFYSYP